MLLSIIVTVYNVEKYIKECLNSIITEDCSDYEIIIVDDGSYDESLHICRQYEIKYPRIIRLYSLSSPGKLGRAHAFGFNKAKGKYIQFVDGDDFLEQFAVENILKIIKENDMDVVMGSFKCFLEEGATALRDAKFDKEIINNLSYNRFLKYIIELPSFHMVFVRYIFKKSIIKRKNLFFSEVEHYVTTNDWLPSVKILTMANSVYYMDGVFYNYRRRTGSVTSRLTKSHYTDHFLTLLEIIVYLSSIEVDKIKEEYVFSRIELMLEISFSGMDNLGLEEWNKIFSAFEKNMQKLDVLKNSKNAKLIKFFTFIERLGLKKGMLMYGEEEQINHLKIIKDNYKKDIYIFPVGIKSQAIARCLKEYDINVVGFLDNDNTKWNNEYFNIPCFNPNIILKMSKYQKDNTIIYIAPLYSSLSSVLKNQILEYDFIEKNIIIEK